MQILKVYDNGPPAMEVGTTHKYELKDKDRFRLTARPKLYNTYLIFVIFFTRAKFLENKIYTQKTRKLLQNTQ